jgi:hypothetical protein
VRQPTNHPAHISIAHKPFSLTRSGKKGTAHQKTMVGAEGRKGIEPRAMANHGGLYGRINLAKRPVHSAGSLSSEE